MLHTPNYDVRTRAYCGPTAISSVTGQPISVIRDEIRKFSERMMIKDSKTVDGKARPVRGVSNQELIGAMYRLGWEVVEKQETENNLFTKDVYRLGDFLDDHGDDGPYIVNVCGHYYAVSHGEICDTYTCLPKDIACFRRGRKRWVERWWKFKKLDLDRCVGQGLSAVI